MTGSLDILRTSRDIHLHIKIHLSSAIKEREMPVLENKHTNSTEHSLFFNKTKSCLHPLVPLLLNCNRFAVDLNVCYSTAEPTTGAYDATSLPATSLNPASQSTFLNTEFRPQSTVTFRQNQNVKHVQLTVSLLFVNTALQHDRIARSMHRTLGIFCYQAIDGVGLHWSRWTMNTARRCHVHNAASCRGVAQRQSIHCWHISRVIGHATNRERCHFIVAVSCFGTRHNKPFLTETPSVL